MSSTLAGYGLEICLGAVCELHLPFHGANDQISGTVRVTVPDLGIIPWLSVKKLGTKQYTVIYC